VTKGELIGKLQDKTGLNKVQAEKVIKAFGDVVIEGLLAGQQVKIAGLGTFSAVQRSARTVRNPKSGEQIDLPAMMVPKYRPAKSLKEWLN
jgi:DNA-binding protein HU-beta